MHLMAPNLCSIAGPCLTSALPVSICLQPWRRPRTLGPVQPVRRWARWSGRMLPLGGGIPGEQAEAGCTPGRAFLADMRSHSGSGPPARMWAREAGQAAGERLASLEKLFGRST
jgi:hypothetical protein